MGPTFGMFRKCSVIRRSPRRKFIQRWMPTGWNQSTRNFTREGDKITFSNDSILKGWILWSSVRDSFVFEWDPSEWINTDLLEVTKGEIETITLNPYKIEEKALNINFLGTNTKISQSFIKKWTKLTNWQNHTPTRIGIPVFSILKIHRIISHEMDTFPFK